MFSADTIVGIATPPGVGGIGILRLSGDEAEPLLKRFFRSRRPLDRFQSHRLYLGELVDSKGLMVDEVLAVVMRAPHSYTREDVVEVHCHGGILVLRSILDLFIAAGARLARPGEFTLRAFLNGRLDLSQAEAVIDLIQAKSSVAGHLAARQLQGSVARLVQSFKEDLAAILALIEVQIDFAEEDIEVVNAEQLLAAAERVSQAIQKALANFDCGRILREGLGILIIGKPNVGKSSLLNTLIGEARAIVTDVPGTTRDFIEEALVLEGIPLRLIDTAGIWESSDPVEAEGILRAKEKIRSADLVLFLVDASRPVDRDDLAALGLCSDKKILVLHSKADIGCYPLGDAFHGFRVLTISSHSGEGIEALKQAIVHTVLLADSGGEIAAEQIFSNRRHREALVRCLEGLERFRASVNQGAEGEFLALDLRESLHALGDITGETTPEDILNRIFDSFCIGK
ncbi:MAG: tRNA uridine-5-carboxymethylaminomethyl(34) synthesis GTPase MnmE [Desulfuromonadaceae bacterium]